MCGKYWYVCKGIGGYTADDSEVLRQGSSDRFDAISDFLVCIAGSSESMDMMAKFGEGNFVYFLGSVDRSEGSSGEGEW